MDSSESLLPELLPGGARPFVCSRLCEQDLEVGHWLGAWPRKAPVGAGVGDKEEKAAGTVVPSLWWFTS